MENTTGSEWMLLWSIDLKGGRKEEKRENKK